MVNHSSGIKAENEGQFEHLLDQPANNGEMVRKTRYLTHTG